MISEAEIAEAENRLIEGIKKSDINFLDSVMHKDLLFLTPDGQIITKEKDLASHKAGEMVVDEIILTIENINIIDNTAIVVLVYDTKGKMLGDPIEGRFRYIRIWKQFSDGLKVIGGSCLKI